MFPVAMLYNIQDIDLLSTYITTYLKYKDDVPKISYSVNRELLCIKLSKSVLIRSIYTGKYQVHCLVVDVDKIDIYWHY